MPLDAETNSRVTISVVRSYFTFQPPRYAKYLQAVDPRFVPSGKRRFNVTSCGSGAVKR